MQGKNLLHLLNVTTTTKNKLQYFTHNFVDFEDRSIPPKNRRLSSTFPPFCQIVRTKRDRKSKKPWTEELNAPRANSINSLGPGTYMRIAEESG